MKRQKTNLTVRGLLQLGFLVLLTAACTPGTPIETAAGDLRIRPFEGNPFYWQYRGEPVYLIGASDYHNIFQRDDLVEHLEKLHAVGGNYVRNTMSSREILPDHQDLWPFQVVRSTDDPLIHVYDLDVWNDEYWRRFARTLEETARRDMIVEVEVWERHDYYRTRDQAGWLRHPYNPDNNVNYTAEESKLPTGEFPQQSGHPFFASVPSLDNNELLLAHQRAFVDKILSLTFEYDHVLYNMNNETRERPEWGEYWARYILEAAERVGKRIEITDMQDAHDVTDPSVERVIRSDLYTFVDISQNNFQRGELHWERILFIRDRLKGNPRPITNIKVYGRDDAPPPEDFWGSSRDGIERFWRNLMGGASSTRFHRPMWGLGLTDTALTHVRSMRMLTDAMDVFSSSPCNELLAERRANEAFCLGRPGSHYAVYFPAGGSIRLDVSAAAENPLSQRWLDLERSVWGQTRILENQDVVLLETPGPGHWVALLLETD